MDERKAVRVTFGAGRSRPEFKDECDVNKIVGRYRTTGFLPQRSGQPVYGDFTNVDDYQTALEKVRRAQEAFMSLPARLRARVDNDPGKFVAWATDPANVDELRELGLVPPGEEAPVTDPVTPAAE